MFKQEIGKNDNRSTVREATINGLNEGQQSIQQDMEAQMFNQMMDQFRLGNKETKVVNRKPVKIKEPVKFHGSDSDEELTSRFNQLKSDDGDDILTTRLKNLKKN